MRFILSVLVVALIFHPNSGHSLSFAFSEPDARSEIVTSQHTIKVRGTPLSYTARAGFIPLHNEVTGEVHANMFFVSYTVKPRLGEPPRPLTFYTDGGPGGPATLSYLGPRSLKSGKPQGQLPLPPYEMVDNQETWLTMTDLVLIDPVGTGYSRATKTEYASEFYNPDGDAESVA